MTGRDDWDSRILELRNQENQTGLWEQNSSKTSKNQIKMKWNVGVCCKWSLSINLSLSLSRSNFWTDFTEQGRKVPELYVGSSDCAKLWRLWPVLFTAVATETINILHKWKIMTCIIDHWFTHNSATIPNSKIQQVFFNCINNNRRKFSINNTIIFSTVLT